MCVHRSRGVAKPIESRMFYPSTTWVYVYTSTGGDAGGGGGIMRGFLEISVNRIQSNQEWVVRCTIPVGSHTQIIRRAIGFSSHGHVGSSLGDFYWITFFKEWVPISMIQTPHANVIYLTSVHRRARKVLDKQDHATHMYCDTSLAFLFDLNVPFMMRRRSPICTMGHAF